MQAKKLIMLLSSLALLLGIIFIASPVNADSEFYPGTIYYEKDGVIIENILAAGLKNEIGNGSLPAVSPNGKYLAYYDTSNYPVIYNIKKGTKKTLKNLESSPANQPVWSPNSKYFTIESHTSTNNYETIINKKGKIITSFYTLGDFYWWNSKKLIYTTLIDPVADLNIIDGEYRPRGDSGGDWYGVARLNIFSENNYTNTVLLIPDEYTDYQVFDIKNNKIRYSKTTVDEYNDWYNAVDQTLSYGKMNINGNNLKTISQPKTWEEKISEDLPAEYANYIVSDFDSFNANHWRLFTLRETYDSDANIYVIYLKSPETMFMVDTGENPTW